ncbi:MAG: Xaa-Pro peptidase family protein [Sedimentisphaerales bacterium]
MNIGTLKTRQKRIREGMSRAGVGCLIVTRPANVTYVTGFLGQDSWAIVLPKAVILITDSRYSEQAAKECKKCKIVIRKDAMIKTVAGLLLKQSRRAGYAHLKKWCAQHTLQMRIGIEKSTTLTDFEGLKKELKRPVGADLRVCPKPVANIIETIRRVKDDGEIAAIKAAAKIAGRALGNATRRMRAGMTENELTGILDFEIRKLGGHIGFETIVAFGPNAARPHHRPTDRKLRKNDTVLIDFGVRIRGYNCDITRCFTTGKTSGLFSRVYNTVSEAQAAAIKMVKAGVKIKDVDAAARMVLKKYRLLVYGHGTGHGLGLEIHEAPSLSPKTEGVLQAGEVITIEPGVYLPGKLGIRIEDDILVTRNGFIILSEVPK